MEYVTDIFDIPICTKASRAAKQGGASRRRRLHLLPLGLRAQRGAVASHQGNQRILCKHPVARMGRAWGPVVSVQVPGEEEEWNSWVLGSHLVGGARREEETVLREGAR